MKATPFVKWVGGKRKLTDRLRALAPAKFERYVEPFLGGGALFFALRSEGYNGPALLCDVNMELVITYRAVRDFPTALVRVLRQHVNTEEAYYKVRAQSPDALDTVERAARFIYLNKTCFNGVYRVNKSGRFNVPFGRQANPTICDEPAIYAASSALYNATLECRSFASLADEIGAGDFAYCDPPYVPVSSTAKFVDYTVDGFTLEDQRLLAEHVWTWAGRGASVLLSNADVPLVRELYSGLQIEEVQMARAINSKGTGRGKVGEVVVVAGPARSKRVA